MRLPFPERISLLYVFFFAAFLCTTQVFEGTSGEFAGCSFLFIMISAITFNLAGGFTRPSGSYIFFYAVLGLIIGLIWKAILGEPADSNLSVPLVTIKVYLGGICALLAAVYLSRKLTTKRAILGPLLAESDKQNATIGCMVTGIFISILQFSVPHPDGSILSALLQLNRFLVVAILLGVTRQIKRSFGTSSVSLPVLISFAILFITGVLSFSKEGMITPFFCWVVAACSLRYRVSIYQLIGGALTALFIFQFLVPYSQYGRSLITGSISENIGTSVSLLTNLGYVRQQFLESEETSTQERDLGYFNSPQGFFDRLEMISIDDALINITEQGQVFGLQPILSDFENLIPHVFWPNKPTLYWGTLYAQEIGGLLPEEDTTTGISFTPSAEAFHLARWTGILIVAPILFIMLFTLFDSLCGDSRKSPWGLLVIPLFAHTAPEAGLWGVIYMLGYAAFGIIFAAYTAAYLMPIVGTLVAGPQKHPLLRLGSHRAHPSVRISPSV